MKNPLRLLLVIACGLNFFLVSSAWAVTLRTNQSKIRLVASPNIAYTGSIEVENPSDQTLIVKVNAEDWLYSGAFDGSKEFFPPDSTRFSCADWISFFPANFVMTPFSKQKLNYTVKTPDALQHGYYAVLFFESQLGKPDLKEGVGVNLIVRIGTLFYIEPQGSTKREAEISNLSLKTGTKGKNLDVSLDLKNTGNVDITTESSFSIIDSKGIVFARGEFNPAYTLPGDLAKLVSGWKERLAPGSYDLVVTVDIGKSLEEAGLGRGPIIVKEAQLEIGPDGEISKIGELK